MTADRCKETTTTTGTGDITLLGAVTQFQAFGTAFTSYPATVSYAIVGQTGAEWEVGVGTLMDANTLERTTVQDSSNAGAAVSFSAGTKDVFATVTAADIAGILSAIAGKAATVHTHAIADTTGLQGALDAKAATGHGHAAGDITGLATVATSGSAADLGTGTLPDGRFPATLPAASGVNLTALNASNLGSGTVPTARLGSGTANATTFLRGDQTYAVPSEYTKYQSASQSSSVNTTYANIADLNTIPVVAGLYHFRGCLVVNAPAAGGAKYQVTHPALTNGSQLTPGQAGRGISAVVNSVQTAGSSATTSSTMGAVTAAHVNVLVWFDFYAYFSTSGNVNFQFAQNAASGTSTIEIGSFVEVCRKY